MFACMYNVFPYRFVSHSIKQGTKIADFTCGRQLGIMICFLCLQYLKGNRYTKKNYCWLLAVAVSFPFIAIEAR